MSSAFIIFFLLIVDAKPPILRRLEAKSNASEIFYNSNSKSNKSGGSMGSGASSNGPNVSKSCNEIGNVKKSEKDSHQLQDSLKIYNRLNPVSNFRVLVVKILKSVNFSNIILVFILLKAVQPLQKRTRIE